MPISKTAYVAHVPGHKNSKGEAAPWVIKDHKDDHIISSHKTQAEAKSHLRDMHAHSGSQKTATASDEFTRAYIEAALWSSTDDEGNPLDNKYGAEDIAPSTLKVMVEDCKKFQQENDQLITGCTRGSGEYSEEAQAGHDFWLTRCGHGAGFWDGDWPENGDALTKASKAFGEADLYVGDDGYIYQYGTETGEPVPPRNEYNPTQEELDKLKIMGVTGSAKEFGVLAHISNPLLRKKEPKLAFGLDQQTRQYDYEANGNDVVLISPSNVTKLLEGEEANSFWVSLDGIESQTLESQEEYSRQIQDLIRSYFERDISTAKRVGAAKAKYVIQVDATGLKKASITYVLGVTYKAGTIDKLKFTTNRAKAKEFPRLIARKLIAQLPNFRLTGSLKLAEESIEEVKEEDYGQEVIIDIHDVPEEFFTKKNVRQFVEKLCDEIQMKRGPNYMWGEEKELHAYANPKVDGLSCVQFLYSSSITIHAINELNKVFLNIFSCKTFDSEKAKLFTEKNIGGRIVSFHDFKRI
jgi:S-adenosylmethionine/arginine decarboxylase-like enzyme